MACIVILIIFSTGLILISLGIIGLYIAKIFEQTKKRPLYIIEKHLNYTEKYERLSYLKVIEYYDFKLKIHGQTIKELTGILSNLNH